MYTKDNEHQYSFKNDWFMVPEVDKNHQVIKIADAMDWVSISEKLSKFYCSNNGRPTKPSRAKVGLLMLKHLNGLSDENVVDMLKRDLYAQYLCDVSLKEAQKFIDPSTLTYFRKQIGPAGVKLIEDEVLNILRKNKMIRGRRLVTDTTVMPVNMAYPTDVDLLDKIRGKAVEYINKAKGFGAKTYRTYQRTARKIVITYQKVRKHTIKTRRKVQKKLLQFSSRNVRQLSDALKTAKESSVLAGQRTKEQFIEKAEHFLQTATNIIAQQKQIYQNKKVSERIVSVHKTHIRPMVRGKYPVEVEFGPKILVNLQGNCLFLEDIQFNNVSDTQLLEKSLNGYKERFGKTPTQLATDRGFWSKANHRLAEDFGIKKIAMENKGKSNYLNGLPFRERLRRARCKIEAKISLAKRKYGLARCLYSIQHGEEMWARLGLISMNLKMAFNYG